MIRRQSTVLAIVCALHWSTTSVSAQQQSPPLLLWSDEFNETTSLDTSYWTARTGNNNGWGNGELQVYTSNVQNVAIFNNEQLAITVLEHVSNDTSAIRTFSSGRVDTYEKVHIKYGTISAKIQVPNVEEGLWPAFWTLGAVNESSFPFPNNGEMDIMEIGQGLAFEDGVGNRRSISGAHWERDGVYTTMAGARDFNTNLNDTYFVYTLDWTPFNITTYVNDDQVWTMDIGEANCVDCEEFHRFHYLLLNVAVGGGFTSGSGSSSSGGGSSSSSSSGCGSSSSSGSGCALRTPADITAPLPATMMVDWVRIFDNGYSEIIIVNDGQVTAPAPVTVTAPVAVTGPVGTDPLPAPVPAPVVVVAPVAVVAPVSVVAPVPVPVGTPPIVPTAPVPVPVVNVVVPSVVAPVSAPAPEANIFFPGSGGKGGKGSGKGGKGGDSNVNANSNGSGSNKSGKKSNKGNGGGSSSVETDLALNSAATTATAVTNTCAAAVVVAAALHQLAI